MISKHRQKILVFILWLVPLSASQAYEPQFSVGLSGSERSDVYRYGLYAEYFHEKMMFGNLIGFWPRLEYDTDRNDHAVYLNALTLFGMANFEYAYNTRDDGLHSYGVELNSRFIPAVLIAPYSMRNDRIVRDIEFFARVHNYINADGRFYQFGVKLGFYFPGFKVSE